MRTVRGSSMNRESTFTSGNSFPEDMFVVNNSNDKARRQWSIHMADNLSEGIRPKQPGNQADNP
jgi:hypothetical protein